ncbi:MAG: hypothetical protein KY469_19405 [Actinobacteria bacterium]|nr:hypothetical protein [Actinomycetota bacterium]
MQRRRFTTLIVSVLGTLLGTLVGALVAPSSAAFAQEVCGERILVLGAMPLEVQPLLDAATLDPADTVRVGDATFHLGQLADERVIIAMTGIGLVNAERTVATAFEELGCDITAVVFPGVAGSVHRIGDVAVPERWTLDGGETWLAADPAMVATARTLVGQVALGSVVPIGDDACVCPGVQTLDTTVALEHQPELFVGGDGTSSDTFNGHALPCVPGGGDVFGCQPCLTPVSTAQDVADFAVNAPDWATPEFFTGFFTPPAETTDTYASQDMESAAAAAAAARYGAPFLAVRAASDGQGDPLSLPGFPFQFFAYRHLAGDNAAAVTIAFLEAWPPRGAGGLGDGSGDAPPGRTDPDDAGPDRDPAPRPAVDGAPTGTLPATGGGVGALAVGLAALASLSAAGRR